jgi:tetratricopeptide (TPR) repeat protein
MPGECAAIWEKHGIEILMPASHAGGHSPADILSLPDYQFPIADLWEEAERTDKVIKALESVRRRYLHLQGVNRRLADCYLRTGDPETAAQRIEDEAKRDEAFRQDSIVRLFLRQCGKAQEAERHLKEAQEKYESSPNSSGQRTAIRNVLLLTWKPFVRLSQDVQSRWVMALHWCYGEHPAAFSGTERACRAIGDCTLAFETHLQVTLFEPLRRAVTETEIDSLPDIPLKSFLVGGTSAGLAMMLNAVASAKETISDVSKRLLDLLSKRCSNSDALRHEKYDAIPDLRNPNAHDCRPGVTGISIEQAQKCIELCQEFLTILETPPFVPRPGQPVQGR